MNALGDYLGPREVSVLDIGVCVVFSIVIGCWAGYRSTRK